MFKSLLICIIAAGALFSCTSMNKKDILIIGHRGASGHRPEHTLESYKLAIEMGADYIEPDLVMTKDGVLVARHENEISQTTDVASKFPALKTTKSIDGQAVTGWFVEDLTFEQLKTLKARERLPFRSQQYNDQFDIPTFKQVIELAQQRSKETGRTIGVYPELKHPTYFAGLGLDMAKALLADLKAAGWDKKGSPVFIQCFEWKTLATLRQQTELPLIFLMDAPNTQPYDFVVSGDSRTYGDLVRAESLRELAKVVTGIGPWKGLLFKESEKSKELVPTSVVTDARAAGLKIHAYTFRNESQYLHPSFDGDPQREYEMAWRLGLDGVFTDFPDEAFKFLRQ